MGLSGFVLELLVPGLLAILAPVVLALEFGIIDPGESSSLASTVLISSLLVAAYLAGIALRHLGRDPQWLCPHSEVCYQDQLSMQWPEKITELRLRWLDDAEGDSLSSEAANEIVVRMRDYYLSTASEAWSGQLLYQWNVARVARNSLLPMILMIGSLGAIVVRRIVVDGPLASLPYLLIVVGLLGLLVALRRAHRSRMGAMVDVLVNTDLAHVRRARS